MHRPRQKRLYHEDVKTIFLQALPMIILTSIGSLVAGVIFKNYLDFIQVLPGIFILLPALMNLKGAIANSFAARLGTEYHLGKMETRKEIQDNFTAAILLSFLAAVLTSIFTIFFSNIFIKQPVSPLFIFILAISASIIGTIFLSLITILLFITSIKFNLDPNNVTFPWLTTIGDLSIAFIAYFIIISVGGWFY